MRLAIPAEVSHRVHSREVERNLSNLSRTSSQSRPRILFHMRQREVEERARYIRAYTSLRCVCGCTLKSKLVPPGAVFSITALSSRTREYDASSFLALGRTLRKPSSSFLTSPPLFLVFFFSLPLFLARSKALLGTSLRFSRA